MNDTRSKILAAMPATITQLMAKFDCSRHTAAGHVIALRDAQRIHIGGWAKPKAGPGAMGAVYHAGPGEDVPCPQPRRVAKTTGKRASASVVVKIPPRDAITTALFGPR